MKLLDLYCGAGGCAMGYHRAAEKAGIPLEIVGIDIVKQKNYPFTFIQGDAQEHLHAALSAGTLDFYHLSPPCKRYSALAFQASSKHQADRQLEAVRDTMRATNVPYVIENVKNTPIRPDVKLFGEMFGLKTIRERWFELGNWWFMPNLPPMRIGGQRSGEYLTIAGKGGYNQNWQPDKMSAINRPPSWSTGSVLQDRKIAMGIDWMTSQEMSQAIPPAYTEYIFTHYLKQL